MIMNDQPKDPCREMPCQVQNTRAGGLVGNVEITGQMKRNRRIMRRDEREKPLEMIGGTTMQLSAHPRRTKNSACQLHERVVAGKALFEQTKCGDLRLDHLRHAIVAGSPCWGRAWTK